MVLRRVNLEASMGAEAAALRRWMKRLWVSSDRTGMRDLSRRKALQVEGTCLVFPLQVEGARQNSRQVIRPQVADTCGEVGVCSIRCHPPSLSTPLSSRLRKWRI